MTFVDYFKDKLLLLLLHLSCMMVLAFFLHATGYPAADICIILVVWLLILSIWFLTEYFRRRQYFHKTAEILAHADHKYLLGELMPQSFRLEDTLYRNMIRQSNKSVIESIRTVEDARQEYREYIESWVHEIKAPIANITLLCEKRRYENPLEETAPDLPLRNQPDDASQIHVQTALPETLRRILHENQKTENYVDMALFYARSDEVYKDYLIKESSLQQTAEDVLRKNKYYLIQSGIQAEVNCKDTVYTDVKWIAFILNQLVLNAVKYRRDTEPKIRIYTEKRPHGVCLTVEDNGQGIPEEDLPRIFDKGFTGNNGRTHERSTGMGLYLCRKLCLKLGIQIDAVSEESAGTKLLLQFPVSNYLSKL
jgi:signal transduction histidine kinase